MRGALAGLRQARRRSFVSQFDALISYSRRGAKASQELGFPAERIFVAPNAVSLRPQGATPVRPATFAGPANVIYVGRLQLRKRIESLLRAAAGLPKELQPKLHIVGDGPARVELKRLAAEIYPAAEFTGALVGPSLDARLASADLFVLPGTGGLAIQQALAHGLPIIVAEGDGSQEDMVSAANGWRVPPGDEAALRATLAEALSDGERLRQMGAASFRLARERFNLEAMVQGFITTLNEVTK
jgi:glycosyltransferase involved in cell wall biosynthesis